MRKKIVILPIKGMIYESEIPFILPFGLPGGVTEIKRRIEKLEKEDDVCGVIFEIDSPGGTPYPCKELARVISNMKKAKVALIRENCLSGAYWIASACDKIVADELSRVGGIGVASIRPDFSEFLKKLGIKFDSSATGKYKELGFPFKEVNEEEKELFREQIETINKMFIEDIARRRKLGEEEIKEISQGKPYLGVKAKELGLIDHLGGREDAIEICKKEAGVEDARIIDYEAEMRKNMENTIEKAIGRIIRKLF